MEFYQLLSIILKHKRMIILFCLSATITAVLLTYVITEKYEATALILVRPQDDIKITSSASNKELLNFPITYNIPFKATSQTYTEVIKSRTIAEKVVNNLHLDQGKKEKKWWRRLKNKIKNFKDDVWTILKHGKIKETNPFEKAVEKVQKSVSVNIIKDTYLFEIKFKHKDQQVVAAVANEAAEAFVKYLTELNKMEAKGTREFIEQQLQESEKALNKTRLNLKQFKEREKIVLLEEEMENEISVLSDFENSLENIRKDIKGTEAEIQELRTSEINISYQKLLEELFVAKTKLISLKAKEKSLISTITKQKNRIENYPKKEFKLTQIELDLKIAADTHEFIKKTFEESRIAEAEKITEIRIASPAVVPNYPVTPIKVYAAGVSLGIALIIGIGLAFFLEYVNIKIRNIEEAEKALDLPVLATIPVMEPTTQPVQQLQREV